jgi:hypothetical protein
MDCGRQLSAGTLGDAGKGDEWTETDVQDEHFFALSKEPRLKSGFFTSAIISSNIKGGLHGKKGYIF